MLPFKNVTALFEHFENQYGTRNRIAQTERKMALLEYGTNQPFKEFQPQFLHLFTLMLLGEAYRIRLLLDRVVPRLRSAYDNRINPLDTVK